MGKIPSWDADSHPVRQKASRLLRNPKVNYMFSAVCHWTLFIPINLSFYGPSTGVRMLVNFALLSPTES
jgi:hypothetical protein